MYIYDRTDNNYIRDYTVKDDSNVEVLFTGNRLFKNVDNTSENIIKLNGKFEGQAKEAIPLNSKYKLKKIANEIGAFLSCGVSAVCCIDLRDVINLSELLKVNLSDTTLEVVSIVGAATFLKCLVGIIKNKNRVDELTKFTYYFENRSDLVQCAAYDNSLAGISKKQAELILQDDKKFKSLKSIDDVNLDTMSKIVSNIRTARDFNFKYQPQEDSKQKKK